MAKTWMRGVLISLLILLAGSATVIFVFDPFQAYHRPTLYLPLYEGGTQAYMNAGVTRNFDYDALIVGTSMTENFRPSLVDETFGVHSVKVPFGGGMANNFAQVLDLAFHTHTVRRVFYGLDMYSFVRDPKHSAFEMPTYLYNADPFDDVSYLLNGEILFRRIPSVIKHNLLGSPVLHVDRDSVYAWAPDTVYSKAVTMASYDFTEPAVDMWDRDVFADHVQTNFDRFVRPYLQAHPDTQFTFFFPPYSSLQWYMMLRQGHLEGILRTKESLAQWLLEYPNVRLYDFTAHTEWVANLDLYKDYSHYSPLLNEAMTLEMAQDRFLVTAPSTVADNNEILRGLARDFPVPIP